MQPRPKAIVTEGDGELRVRKEREEEEEEERGSREERERRHEEEGRKTDDDDDDDEEGERGEEARGRRDETGQEEERESGRRRSDVRVLEPIILVQRAVYWKYLSGLSTGRAGMKRGGGGGRWSGRTIVINWEENPLRQELALGDSSPSVRCM